jgi:hypothetical protein
VAGGGRAAGEEQPVGTRGVGEDFWVARLDRRGNALWELSLGLADHDDNGTHHRSYGFGMLENATAFDRAPNGDLFLAGAFFDSDTDSHVLRLAPNGRPPTGCGIALATDPNQWSSPLTVAPVVVLPEATGHTTASSAAVPIPMDTGRFLCSTPGG